MSADIKFRRDIFGLHVSVETSESTTHLRHIEESDLDKRWRQRFSNDVWMYRNPQCNHADLQVLVDRLNELDGTWNLKLTPNDKRDDYYAILKLGDFNAAQMWGWQGVSNWQKWSQQEEKEHQSSEKCANNVQVSKDGKSVRVRVSVEQLGDEDPD